MKTFKLCLFGLLLAAAVALPLLTRQRTEVRWREQQVTLSQQAELAGELAAENQRVSNRLAQADSGPALSEAQVAELLKLRNRASQLRRALGEADQLQRRLHRTRGDLQDLANGRDTWLKPTALLADEIDVRRARLDRLKQWLEDHPDEKIPELLLYSEEEWIRSADHPCVSDNDYAVWMSVMRSNAEGRFNQTTFAALKQYAQANDGAFPTDLSQLKPYFKTPIDDATLQRYAIVPAKSLIQYLAEVGGDWVITQKTPINKDHDGRVAIGARSWRVTLQEGRWDPVQ